MPRDINLLPEEFRDKDLKDKQSVRKKPKVLRIEMSNPQEQKGGSELKQPKPSLLSRLFTGRSEPAKPLPSRAQDAELPRDAGPERGEEKKLHIPKPEAKGSGNVAKVDMLSGGFLFGSKDVQKEEIPEAPEEVPVPPDEPERTGQEKVILNTRRPEKEKKERKPKRSFFSSLTAGLSRKGGKRKKGAGGSRVDREIDVNLIPTDMASRPEENVGRKGFVLGMTAFVALLIVATAYLGITWYQLRIAREIRMIEEEILSYNTRIRELEQQRQAAIRLQDRLKHVDDLLGNHLYWTKFFEMLENYTIPDVFYTSFAMSGTETVSLAAEARNYRAVAQQLVVLQQATDFVASVDINAASANINLETGQTRSVAFIVNLRLRPDVFLKRESQ